MSVYRHLYLCKVFIYITTCIRSVCNVTLPLYTLHASTECVWFASYMPSCICTSSMSCTMTPMDSLPLICKTVLFNTPSMLLINTTPCVSVHALMPGHCPPSPQANLPGVLGSMPTHPRDELYYINPSLGWDEIEYLPGHNFQTTDSPHSIYYILH